jgi:hypothetical protein
MFEVMPPGAVVNAVGVAISADTLKSYVASSGSLLVTVIVALFTPGIVLGVKVITNEATPPDANVVGSGVAVNKEA